MNESDLEYEIEELQEDIDILEHKISKNNRILNKIDSFLKDIFLFDKFKLNSKEFKKEAEDLYNEIQND